LFYIKKYKTFSIIFISVGDCNSFSQRIEPSAGNPRKAEAGKLKPETSVPETSVLETSAHETSAPETSASVTDQPAETACMDKTDVK